MQNNELTEHFHSVHISYSSYVLIATLDFLCVSMSFLSLNPFASTGSSQIIYNSYCAVLWLLNSKLR